ASASQGTGEENVIANQYFHCGYFHLIRRRKVWGSMASAPAKGQRRKSRKGLSWLDSLRPVNSLASSALINAAYSFSPMRYSEKIAKIGVSIRVVACRLKA